MIQWLYKFEALRRFFSSFWATFASSALIFGGGVVVAIALRNLDNVHWRGVCLGAVLLGSGWFLTHAAKKFEVEAKESSLRDIDTARRKAVASFNGRIAQVYTLLLKVVDPASRQDNLEAYIQAVMGISVSLFDVDGVRACLYSVDGTVTYADTDQPTILVHRPPHCGRADAPRAAFKKDTPHGDLLFDVLATRKPLHIPDTGETSKPIDSDDKKYSSFVAVPVYSGSVELGLLMLDAADPNSLKDEHVVTAQTLASLLAIGLNLSAPGGRVVPTRRQGDMAAWSIRRLPDGKNGGAIHFEGEAGGSDGKRT
ncbi:GAF domain-containing protein [Arthrobacter sp. MSA 4-2]|uniref:GAF domain-containing protein n=1 Tax=Arthrobacter sp. MSA 4-2 TaxID=2794349 RepID=UPI0018E6F279|nr:GAF domain-containing protein [Arthrobacter sp. MSA 4-2]MBJ2120636.1 GAF domain-containing protein [Arthrobacter sp. MSA 4-2]